VALKEIKDHYADDADERLRFLKQYVARVERLILSLEGPDISEATYVACGVEGAKLLEQVLKGLLRISACSCSGRVSSRSWLRESSLRPGGTLT
jgi:hypothetical protein